MKIHEILARDPRSTGLANNGQARIVNDSDDNALAEVRAELETFVCEGRFSDAIERIVGGYLSDLDNPRQNSVWVSGFYGSGKSHLLKMLTHLWVNTTFDGGSTARNVVSEGLPDEIQASLRELDTQVTRTGNPPVAAAGTMLGGNEHVRSTVLSIILRAGGWPTQYHLADFCFWLRDENRYDSVRSAVEESGRDWLSELNNLHVSPVIAKALLQEDKSFAPDEGAVRQTLLGRFPRPSTDITTEQFVEAAKRSLGVDGNIPLTLVVLDEVQQYIGDSVERASIVTELAEALQTQFDSRVILVCAGQSALESGTPNLQRLLDRFRVRVQLTDQDVEAVTRKVLLRKKSQAIPDIESLLYANSGEISRHLQGSKIGQLSEDKNTSVIDYPLLLTRRRFWESCFLSVDQAGTNSQLRSQLRILYDSLRDIADRDLGHVIPGSDVFNALSPSLVNTGVLLNEINARIHSLEDGTEDGLLRRDICGLAFLINKLPREDGVDIGVRADAITLADLLVDKINSDSGPFRNKVEILLDELAADGTLMKVGFEYRLQTTQGSEWEALYREKSASLRQNIVEISTRREQIFAQQIQQITDRIKLPHGDAKIQRNLSISTGNEAPQYSGDRINVWIRNGWICSEQDVVEDARKSGQDDATIYVHLPRKSDGELTDSIISFEAARQVSEQFGVPSSPEGREAKDSMQSRMATAEQNRNRLVVDLLRASKVFSGGGSEVFGEELGARIERGAESSLARLYPRFDQGDHISWPVALNRAKDGSDEPFKALGWDKPTEDHPVAKEILTKLNVATQGNSLQNTFKAAPYGWPPDAIDAALIALHRSRHIRATRNGQSVGSGDLNQTTIKTMEFRLENVRLTAGERIKLRGIFQAIGVNTKNGEEELRAPQFLEAMLDIARKTGGEAPLPAEPDTTLVIDLRQLTGAEQLVAILQNQDSVEEMISQWTSRSDLASVRLPMWQLAESFRLHSGDLPIFGEVSTELNSIKEQRSLLHDMDPITPLIAKFSAALREALVDRHNCLTDYVGQGMSQLEGDATWQKLDPADRTRIVQEIGLIAPVELDVSTEERLRTALDNRSLKSWQAEIDAVSARRAKAMEEAVKCLKDKDKVELSTISVRRGTLADESEVDAWLVEHSDKLKEAVKKGAVIVE